MEPSDEEMLLYRIQFNWTLLDDHGAHLDMPINSRG